MPGQPPTAAVYTIQQPLELDEVAQILRCSVKTVQRRIAAGELQAFQVGTGKRGGWRVRPEWLDEFMETAAERATRGPRPLDDVHRVDPSEHPPTPRRPSRRRRRNASGTLAVKPGMGRAA